MMTTHDRPITLHHRPLELLRVLCYGLALATGAVWAQEAPSVESRVLRVWGTETGTELAAVTAAAGSSFTLSAGPEPTRVVTIAPDETVTVWDSRTGELLSIIPGREDSVHVFEELCSSCKKRLGLRNFEPVAPAPAVPSPLDVLPPDEEAQPERDGEPPLPAEEEEEEGDAAVDLASIPPPDQELAARVNAQLDRMLDKRQRELARQVILPMGESIVPVLRTRMYDRELTIRWEVVNLIGQLEASPGRSIIADRILNDHDHHVRWRAIWSMNRLRDREYFVRAFRAHLESPNSTVAWRAAVGLSALSEPDPICLDAIHRGVDFPDEGKVWEAVNALGRVWNEQSAGVLATVFSKPFQRGRQEAALSLGNIGGPAAVEVLKRALGDSSHQVRWRAARGLGKIGDPAAVPALQSRLDIETDAFTREKIQEALQRLRGAR